MKLHVKDLDGASHCFEGLEGWQVMEIIRDYGLPIKAECGGCCCCATCHVRVASEWLEALPHPSPEEADLLADLPDVTPQSRLSCQIVMSAALDGLVVELMPSAAP